jgi:excisionase family DNA binding protein
VKKPSETTAETRLLTVSEVAKVLGYKSVAPVYNLIAAGEIPTVSLPVRGGTRVDQKDLDVFIERMKRSA